MREETEGLPSIVVVDTDVFSFILDADSRATRYRVHLEGRLAALSFQTVAELWSGAYYAEWGQARRQRLSDEIGRYAIIPFHAPMTEIWARLVAERKRAGREIKAADGWIAATALWARAPVVTHNRRDFSGVNGLKVISEHDQMTSSPP